LIRDGRVLVNGTVAELGRRVDPRRDSITVDGVPIPVHPELRYHALNKPRGVTTTLQDPHAESSLVPYLPPGPRLFPVGRLDRESEGLLLLTNDGELANRLQHPRYGAAKEYLVEVQGEVAAGTGRALVRGIELPEGPARAVRARVEQRGRGRTALTVVMTEGRKREIRRMLSALGYTVTRLVRVRLGSIHLGSLQPGKARPLGPEEVSGLYRLTQLDRAAPRERRPRRRTGGSR